jgi:hypothetical protein
MQMPSSRADCFRSPANGSLGGFFDFLDPSTWFSSTPADPFPSSVNITPQVTSADMFPSNINITPSLMPSSPADTGPGFFSQLPQLLSTGIQTYGALQMIQNPAVQAAMMRPAGVTSSYNPYGLPSGTLLPSGVTPSQYAYPAPVSQPQSIFSNPVIVAALIGAAGLLLVASMGKR